MVSLYEQFMAAGQVKSLLTGREYPSVQQPPKKTGTESASAPAIKEEKPSNYAFSRFSTEAACAVSPSALASKTAA